MNNKNSQDKKCSSEEGMNNDDWDQLISSMPSDVADLFNRIKTQ